MSYMNSFISFYAGKTDMSYHDAQKLIKNFFAILLEHTKIMKKTRIVNFGIFTTQMYSRKYIVNPENRDMLLTVTPRTILKFKPYKKAKEYIK